MKKLAKLLKTYFKSAIKSDKNYPLNFVSYAYMLLIQGYIRNVQ